MADTSRYGESPNNGNMHVHWHIMLHKDENEYKITSSIYRSIENMRGLEDHLVGGWVRTVRHFNRYDQVDCFVFKLNQGHGCLSTRLHPFPVVDQGSSDQSNKKNLILATGVSTS